MSSSAPENIKIWCANGYTNRRFVWKRREGPSVFYSSGVNPQTAPGGARASAAQPFLFLLFHHKFRKTNFSGLQTEGYWASVAWEARSQGVCVFQGEASAIVAFVEDAIDGMFHKRKKHHNSVCLLFVVMFLAFVEHAITGIFHKRNNRWRLPDSVPPKLKKLCKKEKAGPLCAGPPLGLLVD